MLSRHTKKRTGEAGSIMLEVLVVIGLIGLLLPVTYRQIANRMEEVNNVTMAGEIRAVKEGVENYLIAEYEKVKDDPDAMTEADICKFMPQGYCSDSPVMLENFIVELIEDEVDGKPLYRGLIIPRDDVLPDDMSTKRAARIATLVGVEGGIMTDLNTEGGIDGVLGIWHLDDETGEVATQKAGRDAIYVAVTTPDLLPITQHQSENFNLEGVTGKVDMNHTVRGALRASQYFSVGKEGNHCYDTKYNAHDEDDKELLIRSDTIYKKDEGGKVSPCDPLFWVGTIGDKNYEAGHAYVRDTLLVGEDNQNIVEISGDTGKNGVVKVTSTGVDGVTKTITVTGKNIEAEGYAIDAPFTSRVNDIQLVSRGNAKLSEILPNYILKGIYQVNCSNEEPQQTVDKPVCPAGYVPALIVTPIKWSGVKQKNIEVGGVNFETLSFAIDVDGHVSDFEGTDMPYSRANEINDWTVRMGYKKKTTGVGLFETSNFVPSEWEASAQAQTYCFYNPEKIPCADDWVLTDNYNSNGNVRGKICCPTDMYYGQRALRGVCCEKEEDCLTEVEYLESTGIQYIDSGVPASDSVGIGATFMGLANGDNIVIGSKGGGDSRLAINHHSSMKNINLSWNSVYNALVGSGGLNTKFDATLNLYNSRARTVNGVAYAPITTALSASNKENIYLFAALWGGTTPTLKYTGRIYGAQITDGDTLVRDFVPVKTIDGKGGFLDKVHNKLYLNKGSGLFKFPE